ncbi:MAG: ABC-type dipeptide transport system, periplasmic component [Pseudonocardiales bacterium]|nr:ABC-type dipeptide transport system, periplasmic component [Jatrophihabitantaceae bacterium]MCW2602756.1 ABC-type dipeptide transport system, periplasmic component [Pseudonocardiales bacterium]
MRRSTTAAGSMMIALALVAGCSGGSSGDGGNGGTEAPEANTIINGELPADGPAENGGILTVNDSSDSPTFDPHKSATAFTHAAISGIVYSKLLEFDVGRDIAFGSMGVHGDLAEKWDHSQDGLKWTFNLRKGVKFQNVAPVNGRLFSSADVVCTVNRIKTLPGVQKNLMDVVASMDTPDANTIVFNLNTAYGAFDETMASFYMEILPCEGTSGQFDLAQTAIGTGPFIIQKWDRKVQKTYIKNPDYFIAGKPHLDGVNVVIQADPAAAIAAFRTKQIDVTGSVSDTLLPTVLSTNPDAVVQSQLALTMNHIFMNEAIKPFDDIRVRKAVSMAWDRAGMGQTFYPQGFALAGAYPSTLFGSMSADEAAKAIPYDPAAAKKLLAEAGFPNGFDVELMTTDGYGPSITNQAQWVQQDLKDVGINVTLKVLDYATFFSTFAAKGYSIGYGLATGFLTPDEWLQADYKSDGPRNWFNVNDPKLDAMITEQRGIITKGDREKKLQEISKYIVSNVANPIFGMQYTGLLVSQPYVHNLYTHPQYARPYMADVWLDKTAPGRTK